MKLVFHARFIFAICAHALEIPDLCSNCTVGSAMCKPSLTAFHDSHEAAQEVPALRLGKRNRDDITSDRSDGSLPEARHLDALAEHKAILTRVTRGIVLGCHHDRLRRMATVVAHAAPFPFRLLAEILH